MEQKIKNLQLKLIELTELFLITPQGTKESCDIGVKITVIRETLTCLNAPWEYIHSDVVKKDELISVIMDRIKKVKEKVSLLYRTPNPTELQTIRYNDASLTLGNYIEFKKIVMDL